MDWLSALILGLVQGLTEFLPVSSSGHLEIGKALLGVNPKESLMFTVLVHGATVLSTIVVFHKDIGILIRQLFKFQWNEDTAYITKLLLSMLPVAVLGLFFKKEVEAFFEGDIVFVGFMLIVTASLLTFTYLRKSKDRKVGFLDSIVIGIAQALAVLPGISRSGATISTSLMLGVRRELAAKFSFLMVLIPIMGANLKDAFEGNLTASSSVSPLALVVGFLAAFISGLLACKLMIGIVKKGGLIYFAIYCFIIGIIAIIAG
ncbi:MAG: undecaprenyl-diphosphate phosphatase [Bacteroidales bacterium]|nr:undecaprenyl-diphosphate phosphatase [Bacteroidales bacterium]